MRSTVGEKASHSLIEPACISTRPIIRSFYSAVTELQNLIPLAVIVFPNCKINIGLHLLRKRQDGFHDLETIFYPVALYDALEIIQPPSPTTDIELSVSGLGVDGPPTENICHKAYELIKSDYPDLRAVKIHLHKTIPMGAGLGGGSADGAFTLQLLNKKFNLGITEEKLVQYALQLGSDCPFFIKNTPCLATGRGEIMQPIELDLSAYTMAIVNPQIHINTGWAFSQITPSTSKPSLKQLIEKPVAQWKDVLQNDFEPAVFTQYPEIKNCKESLYRAGALYASMTGSGSTVYGIFSKKTTPQFSFPAHYFVKII